MRWEPRFGCIRQEPDYFRTYGKATAFECFLEICIRENRLMIDEIEVAITQKPEIGLENHYAPTLGKQLAYAIEQSQDVVTAIQMFEEIADKDEVEMTIRQFA